jgi:uncharacterized BrkB/YihY/UPF0761 family membrane protein
MTQYEKWSVWAERLRSIRPYANELLSNETYVYVSAIAVNALFSFTPFIILLASVSRSLFPRSGVDEVIYDILAQYLPFTDSPAPPTGRSDLDFVVSNLRAISQGFGSAQLISTVVLVFSVASVFIPLEMALNRALGVQESRGFWRSQWLAVKMAALFGGLALAFVLCAFGTKNVLHSAIPESWAGIRAILNVVNIKLWMIPLILILSCVVLATAPNTKVPFRDVWPAAILTGLLWEVSNYAFIVVLPFLDLYALFGPFTIAVAWVMWAYTGGLILVLGANLMARQALTKQVHRMKEALWSSKVESPS